MVQLRKKYRPARRKSPVNLMIRVRRTYDARVVSINIVKCTCRIEKGVAVDSKRVSMNGIGSRFQLILGNPLGEAVLRGEGAL